MGRENRAWASISLLGIFREEFLVKQEECEETLLSQESVGLSFKETEAESLKCF